MILVKNMVYIVGTQKPTEGTEHGSLERVKGVKSNYFRRNQMAQVTYRGIRYDTNDKRSCQKIKADLTYRGIKHSQEKEYCVVTP